MRWLLFQTKAGDAILDLLEKYFQVSVIETEQLEELMNSQWGLGQPAQVQEERAAGSTPDTSRPVLITTQW